MKLTGTKKLSITLLALGCTLAAGLGVLFGGVTNAPKVYAQSEKHVLPVGDEEAMLGELAELSGISEKDLKFYALSSGGTVEQLYQYWLHDSQSANSDILTFLNDYSQGSLTNSVDLSNEDWFVAPDDVDNYDFKATHAGTLDVWTNLYTSKAFITNESFYWREKNFQWGPIYRNFTVGNLSNASGAYWNVSTATKQYWDSQWMTNIVWLDEGEEFEFGLYSTLKYSNKYLGAMTTDFFIDSYLCEKPYYVRDHYYSSGSKMYASGVYSGLFSDKDSTTPIAETDTAQFGYDTTPTTKADWRNEFGSAISPTNISSSGNWSNSSYLTWASDSLGASNYSAGVHKLHLSADAPSGFYYMGFYRPYYNGYWCPMSMGSTSAATYGNFTSNWNSVTGWPTWNYYVNYGVWVCRTEVTAPEAEYGEGVSSNLRDKTINYSGEPARFTLKNDWGPGLSTVEVEQKIDGTWTALNLSDPDCPISTSAEYVNAAGVTVTCTRDQLRGVGVQGAVTYVAQLAGEYRIKYTPFKKWSDGTDDPVYYHFTIKPMKLTATTLVQEEGVTQATNTKYLYATGKDLYVSLYPVPSKWAQYSWSAANGGILGEFNYSTNGVLTLSGQKQDVYTIKVKLKDPINTAWDNGTADGTTDDLVFTFEIGPEKIVVPDIIQDTGNIGATSKVVTFNGATQSMSFMPIVPSQLDISVYNRTEGVYLTPGLDYATKDNTLTVNAFDAGEYEIKIKVKDQYIFENITKELTYELIIKEAEISAPVLDEPTAVNNVKTVTYGGEKITMPDGTVKDWVATLTFQNADEARVTPNLNGLGQQTWGDSTLVLAARAAGTYSVTFSPKKNYKWKSGVKTYEYTLVIERLKISKPVLVNDGEKGASFTSTLKSIGFDGKEHTFSLQFPTYEGTKDTAYTKRSSVFIVHTGSMSSEVWNDAGDTITFKCTDAGTFLFTITPTNNYCWADDGTAKDLVFTFKIVPQNVDALHAYTSDPLGGSQLQEMNFNTDERMFRQIVSFDGKPKRVEIGNIGATDPAEMYISDPTEPFWKWFALLDENGTVLSDLLPNMTAVEEDGKLKITAIDAGVYRIAVYVGNPNYWWTETAATMIEYRLIIEAQDMPQPTINEGACEGGDIIGHFDKNLKEGKYVMTGVYNADNFLLNATLNEVYRDYNVRQYITITDPNGVEYVHDSSLHDAQITSNANNALRDDSDEYTNPEPDPQKRVYTDWRDNKLRFYAKNQGTYTWKVKIVNTTNYKWSSTTTLELSFTIVINRSPVSGVEMHYVGDKDEVASNTANGIIVEGKTNVRGSDAWANTVKYEDTIYSDMEKEIFFIRTNTVNLVNTGFSTQFDYSIKSTASWDGYDVSKLKELDSNGKFDDERLTLYALDAGKYEITLSLQDNYCWNDTGKTTDSVTFTLVIKKRVLEKPVVIDDDDTLFNVDANGKETTFNHDYQTFRLFMQMYPQGYAIGSFKYQANVDRTENDIEPVRITQDEKYPINSDPGAREITIGVDKNDRTLAMQAKSAGEYLLRVVVSNENNYEFSKNISSDQLQYSYIIKKLKVELPTAYLSAEKLSAEDAVKKVLDNNAVSSQTPGVVKLFDKSNSYTVNTEFNGKYRTVYFYGTDVTKGDFNFTVTPVQSTSADDITDKIIQPDTVLADNAADPEQKAGYFMLAAQLVDTYEIKLAFVSKDFYWSTDSQDAPSNPRSFNFVITKNNIEVPKIQGFENVPLTDDSYSATYVYELDYSTANKAKAQSASIVGAMLGERLTDAGAAADGVYRYSNITVKISSLTDAGHVILVAPEAADLTADGMGSIVFKTSTDGTAEDGAWVTRVYCIELEINPQNSKWSIGDESANKKYYIKISKMQVKRPELKEHDVGDFYNRTKTYFLDNDTSDRWTDALILNNYDSGLMDYALSSNLVEADDLKKFNVAGGPEADGFVTTPLGDYKDLIKLSTNAAADRYILTVLLHDPDNTEWYKDGNVDNGGGTDDLEYSFIIDPMKVAKPYIKATGDNSVIGLTRTLTYKYHIDGGSIVGDAQGLEIGNYWNSNADDYTGVPVIPAIMNYSVASGTLNTGYPDYLANQFTSGTTSTVTGSMKYNAFNNGLLAIEATDAGEYIIRFALTGNAVWADGSTDDIDVKLIIKKVEVADLKIAANTGVTQISGNTATVTYKIDGSGNEVVYAFDLGSFDWNITNVAQLVSGRDLVNDGTGYIEDKSLTGGVYDTTLAGKYYFEASKADNYEVKFTLKDGANFRWKYANTDEITFTFVINKLKLELPELYADNKLWQENVNKDDRTLTVDFDLRIHTILVKSLYEKVQTTPYSTFGAAKYFKVENATAYDGADFTAASHKSELKAYDNTGTSTYKDLYENSVVESGFAYTESNAATAPNFDNLFTLAAYTPGEYIMKFTITNADNVTWDGVTDDFVEYKIIINKYSHDVPAPESGDPISKQYTADDVYFKMVNAYNGIETSDNFAQGTVTSTVSEKFELISYTGNDATLTKAMNDGNIGSLSNNFLDTWFGGTLTLKFKAVGVYVVRVSITDTNNIAWNGTNDKFRDYTFTVLPRELTFDYKYKVNNNPEVQAQLSTLTNSDTPSWPLSTDVDIEIFIRGLRHDPSNKNVIDALLGFEMYYEDPTAATFTKLGAKSYDKASTFPDWVALGDQGDGTFAIKITYSNIPFGQTQIARGSYILHIVQDTDLDPATMNPNANPSNYTFADPEKLFIVEPDPAPFKGHEDMLTWSYSRSDWPAGMQPKLIENIGLSASNRFTDLEYRPGVTYTFTVGLNAKGMAGFNAPVPAPADLDAALATWQVKWNGLYGGTQAVTDAGDDSVSVTIEALDADKYAYANYTFTLYYTIRQAKLDLSKLGWDYDGSSTFEFDGTAKTVNVTGLSDYGTDLLIDRYVTTGAFTSYAPTPVTGTFGPVNSNSVIYAGEYVTKVIFKVPTPSNYVLPDEADGTSYTGTFQFSVSWEIERKEIEVEWLETLTSSSDGDVVTKTNPIIDAPYTSFFAGGYVYEKWDGSAWVGVSAITRVPGTTLKYKALANLKSTPGTPATDYARNYSFRLLGENPLEFEVGGDDTEIVNHIEVSGTKTNGDAILPVTINNAVATRFEYTGNPFVAENIIDLDTTNGLIGSMTITVLYYNVNNPAVAIPAPSAVGSYIVKLKLSYSQTQEDYAFAVSEAKFDIVKAKIKYSDFEWHFRHDDGENVIEAKWDATQSKWIDIATNEEVKLAYDGHAYEIFLSSDYASTVISIIYTENNKINAGSYEATINPTIGAGNVDNYEFDATDPIPETYDWKLEKQFLDLSKVVWDYSKPYEFTIVNGTPKVFKAELKNLPDYLLDKITYTTVRVNESDEVPQTGDIFNAGNYRTVVSYTLVDSDEGPVDLIDHDNYDLDGWPASPFSTTLNWVINRKEMELPANDLSWKEFDGIQHNLLKPFNLDIDWNEYFDIDVSYSELGSSEAKPYDGTLKYGGKYYAYDAGKYSFTLKIKTAYNSDVANIVWVVKDGAGFKKTDDNQTVSYTVDKKALKVIGWVKNYESSTVILSSGIDPSKFIEYDFYKGDQGVVAGNEVTLDDILDSAGNDLFSMVPVVKEAFGNNITIAYEGTGDGYEFIWFKTQEIDQTNAKPVGDKPYIYGYSIEGGGFHRYTSEELAEGVYVYYTGKQVEFMIYNWSGLQSYVAVWNGSLDDLKQTEVGKYSLTLVLRKDLPESLYWGVKDGKVDRSSVTLDFEIRYRELTLPEIPEEIVYEGGVINILDKATNIKLSDLLAEYGDYVTITGNTATNVGEQVLYLKIKDEYGNAVRWNDGSEQGLSGTYSKAWKITPILLTLPVRNNDKLSVEYDGDAHTVFEFLAGYDPENVPQAIKDLIKYINATNAEAIDAGTYTATLSLPGDNFSWCDASGNELVDRSSFKCDWTIDPQLIDFSEAYWGYMDGDEPVRYDSDNPFVYTVKNGVAQYYSLQIMGMPEILKLYATYKTNGVDGNSACRVDTYKTHVVFDLTALKNSKNYTIGKELDDGLAEIEWRIVPREFEAPEFDDSWSVFDGDVHDVVEMLGLGSNWSDYFNIKVEYKAIDGDDWSDYRGEDMLVVGFSNYKLYSFGFYRITVTLKAGEPVWIPNTNIMWKDGVAPEAFLLEVKERDVVVAGWFEDNENSYALFDGGTLPEGIEDKFEYLIYNDDRDENGELKKVPVNKEDIKDSTTYYMELKFKDGTDKNGIKYTYGVNLSFADGVRNPYEFGKFDFAGQSIIWVPFPVLDKATLEYNGDKQTFVIKDFDTVYKMTDAQRLQLNTTFNLNISASTKSFVYLQDVNSLTVTAAGEYTAVVRLLGKVRLSWYDSDKYYASADGKTLYEKGAVNPVIDPDSLYDNKSVILKFNVTPKRVPALTMEELEKLFGLVVGYDGTEKDVTKEAEIFAELEAKYGKIFEYEGNRGTAADIYNLVISLADSNSCSWYNPNDKVEEKKEIGSLTDANGGKYRVEYVFKDGIWKLAVVKVDADGKTVLDDAKKPVEYFDTDGGYKIDVKYQHKFEKEYVTIDVNGDGTKLLIDGDGKVIKANNHFMNGESFVWPYGMPEADRTDDNAIFYEYETDPATGEIIRYSETFPGSNVFIRDDVTGTHINRYKLSLTDGEKDFNYKIFVYEDATEYTYVYDKLTIGGNGKPTPVKGIDGNYVTKYAVAVPGGYELRQYSVDADGEFVLDIINDTPAYTVLETSSKLVNETITEFYSLVNGKYVLDMTNGTYVYRYVLDASGNKTQVPAYEKDANGNYVIDQDRSSITVEIYGEAKGEFVIEEVDGKVTVTEKEYDGLRYKVDWRIDSSVLAIPEFDVTLMQQYTGKTLYAKDVLKGFIPDLMKIEEGGEGVNAGEYTAKIVITTPNSKWNPDITTENYVYVKWRIDTAKLDLKDIKWVFNDGTKTYEDSSSFVYTRKDGNPVIYWVELGNLPEALQNRVVYTTNNVRGAYAGINAGKYITSFTFDIDNNFETVEIPETLDMEITWSIGRRMLKIPEITSVFTVFDNEMHDLLEVLGVPEDWNEYYDIDVKFSNGGDFEPYKGVDGNPYIAYNSGSYMFTFAIKSGINVSATNPNVVWLKNSGETEVPDDGEGEDEGEEEETPEAPAPEAPAALFAEEALISAEDEVTAAPAEAVDGHTGQAPVKSEAIIALEQVCDRINKLVCGAEVQMKSFRKYSVRGTL